MALAANTFLSDTIKFLRDDLDTNMTDPISGSRVGRERFVMTSYPKRSAKYPLITIKHTGTSDNFRLGLQSEGAWVKLPLEVRVWARNVKEKDNLAQEVYTQLRQNQFGANSSTGFELHDFKLTNMIDVDEDGDQGIKSKIINIEYSAVIDG